MFLALARKRVPQAILPIIGTIGLTMMMGTGVAGAALTSPSAGAVYRAGPVPISENVGGRHLKADGVTPMSSTEALSCTLRSGSFPNARTAKGIVQVVRLSDNTVVFQAESPNTAGALSSFINNQSGPWSTSWAIPEGSPAGLYQVRSTAENRTRVSFLNPCQLSTVLLDTKTIEYRPWQHVFKDVFGGGRVNMNITPAEFQGIVANQIGQVTDGATTMSFFALPNAAAYALPADPMTCAVTPASCLPSTAVQCTTPSTSCVPRIVIINNQTINNEVVGAFDLETKAYIAWTNINGFKRVQLSLGTAQDAAYRDLLTQLGAQAAAQGVDLATILATKVRVRMGDQEVGLSLLNGLQIQPNTAPSGVQIVSDATAQAGLILNIYANLDLTGGVCVANVGDSNPATLAPDRYTARASVGYTVERSDLLPDVPRVGAVGALVGGPIYHIKGDFVGTGSALLNTSSAVIGVDTAANEPNGYPVWIQPFVSTPMHVTGARTMDYLGTATWSASETPVGTTGCLTVDFLLGAGVALFNNPLPVGFGTLGIWTPGSPEVQALMAQVNGAVQGAVNSVVADPTVSALLAQITGSLPAVPGVPTL